MDDFEKYALNKEEARQIEQLSDNGKRIMKNLLDLNQDQNGTKTSWILAAISKYKWFGNREIDYFLDLVKGYLKLDTADQEIVDDLLSAYIEYLPYID